VVGRGGCAHGFGHAHGVVIGLDFCQAIDDLLLAGIFNALGQMPTAIGKMGTLEDGEGGPQPDGGRGVGIFEQTAQSIDGEGGEGAHAVTQGGDVFAPGLVGGSLEGGVVEPVVNRIAV
jgi:hypothetical protein